MNTKAIILALAAIATGMAHADGVAFGAVTTNEVIYTAQQADERFVLSTGNDLATSNQVSVVDALLRAYISGELLAEVAAYMATHTTNDVAHLTAQERETWNAKQETITNLAEIAAGAALGSTALQSESDPSVYAWAKEANKPTYGWSEITNKPNFATVATSGAYSDLSGTPSTWAWSAITGKPTTWPWSALTGVPTFATVATSGSYTDLANKPNLAAVATTGAYADLTGKPTIPNVPILISAFTNDAGYLTSYTETDPQAAGIASNVVTTAYIQEKLGVYLYIGQDGHCYVHTPEE